MTKSQLRTDREIEDIFECHINTVYRVCFAYLKNTADTEDAVQNSFVKLLQYNGTFESEEHEKRWLIVVASNICKDYLRHWWNHRTNFAEHESRYITLPFEIDETFEVVMNLPSKYKTVIYLYYYEGYNSNEIAQILNKPQSTIRNIMQDGRNILRKKLGDDFDEE